MRIATRLAGIAAAVLLLVGCASTAPDGEEAQTSPSASAVESASCLDVTSADDLIVPGAEATDEYGTYCTVVLDSAADLTLPAGSIPQSDIERMNLAMTDADLNAAYEAQLTYILEALFDNPRTDNFSQSREEWLAENSHRYDPGMIAQNPEGGLASALMFGDTLFIPSPTVRDGHSRLVDFRVEGVELQVGWPVLDGVYDYSTEVVQFTTTVNATFYATDDVIVESLLQNDANTQEGLETDYPEFFDGIDNGIRYEGTVQTMHTIDNPSVLQSYQVNLNSGPGTVGVLSRG